MFIDLDGLLGRVTAKGALLGAKLACFWPSGLPKWPKIGLACMISVRLTPLGCLVVF